MRVSRIWRSRGGFVCGGKAVCGSVFSGKWDAETSSVEFSKDDPDSVSPSDGADADMTAQPEQMEQEIDEAVSEALSSYQFSVDNFNSMTSVLRGIGNRVISRS